MFIVKLSSCLYISQSGGVLQLLLKVMLQNTGHIQLCCSELLSVATASKLS